MIGETSIIGSVKIYRFTLGLSACGRVSPIRRSSVFDLKMDAFSAGATILGGNTVIGKGSVIGGNVWLTESVPAGTRVTLGEPSLKFDTVTSSE